MERETWRNVKDFDNYEVSDLGRVRNKTTKRILKANTTATSYEKVILSKNGFQKGLFVHRLVATAFIPNPDNLPEVDHIDHDKVNNRVENLRWLSKRDNLLNRIWYKPVIMCDKDTGKYIQVFNDAADAADYIVKKTGKERYPIQVAISQCCNKLAHRHTAYGYKWEFLADFSFDAKRDYLDECDELLKK